MNLKITLLTAICLSTCAAVYAQEVPNNVSATLQVAGTVNDTESTCDLSLSASSITIKDVKVSELPVQGSDAEPLKLDSIGIHLNGEKCNKTNLKFIASTDPTAHDTLLNSSNNTTSAKGVGIGVYDARGSAIDLTKTISSEWWIDFSNVYPIYFRTVKLAGATPSRGDVQASLTVQLENL